MKINFFLQGIEDVTLKLQLSGDWGEVSSSQIKLKVAMFV